MKLWQLEEQLVVMTGLVCILLVVIAAMLVVAYNPDAGAAASPLAAGAIVALGALARRQPAAPLPGDVTKTTNESIASGTSP